MSPASCIAMKRKPPDKISVMVTPEGKTRKYNSDLNLSINQITGMESSPSESSASPLTVSPDSITDHMNQTHQKNYAHNANEVPIHQSSLRLRDVVTIRGVVEQRVVLEMCNGSGQKVAYDADFGYAANCVMLSIHPPPEPKIPPPKEPDVKTPVMETIYTRLEHREHMRILAVRRRRHIIDGRIVSFGPCFAPQFSCGETLMTLHSCTGDDQYCYGFKPMDGAKVQLRKHCSAVVRDGTDPTKAVRANVLLLTLTIERKTEALTIETVTREFAFEMSRTGAAYCGRPLAAPYTGTVEVHTAFEMSMNASGQYTQDLHRVVALKTLKCDEKLVPQLEFVNSTADLNVHYAQRVSNENPVHEIKAMHFLSQHVEEENQVVSRNLIRLHRATVDAKHLHLLLNYYPHGSLFHYLLNRGTKTVSRRTSEAEARVAIRHLAGVVNEMHSVGVAYQDLSTENIIVDSTSATALSPGEGTLCDVQFVLIDMGHVAGHTWNAQNAAFELLAGREKCVGKIIYHCPEFFTHLMVQLRQLMALGMTEEAAVEQTVSCPAPITLQSYSGFQVDSWQFGVLLLCLLTGYSPFDETLGRIPSQRNMLRWFLRVGRGDLSEMRVRHDLVVDGQRVCVQKRLGEIASLPAVRLMESLLCVDPNERITVQQVLSHPWVSGQQG